MEAKTGMETNMRRSIAGKALLVLGGLALMAGCAGGSQGIQPKNLRNSTNFVTERVLGDMDFPTLQSNLFKHRAACGSAPRFVMHEGETSVASLIETPEVPDSYENVVLMDLVQYPESYRSSERVAIRVYSYYYNDDVQRRVDAMLAAIQTPGVCTQPAG